MPISKDSERFYQGSGVRSGTMAEKLFCKIQPRLICYVFVVLTMWKNVLQQFLMQSFKVTSDAWLKHLKNGLIRELFEY